MVRRLILCPKKLDSVLPIQYNVGAHVFIFI